MLILVDVPTQMPNASETIVRATTPPSRGNRGFVASLTLSLCTPPRPPPPIRPPPPAPLSNRFRGCAAVCPAFIVPAWPLQTKVGLAGLVIVLAAAIAAGTLIDPFAQ